jgi:hypothetical protein
MRPFLGHRLTLVALAALFFSGSSLAGLNEGLDALRNQDYATAAKELRPLADKGDAEAQYRIGLMYNYGKGYPQDRKQGVAWLRKSATQGHIAAQQELGVIYVNGEGVPKNDKEAVSWFRKAADQGNPAAQYNLGLMYAKGAGLPLDNAQAIAWFRKSATQGFQIAQFKLGVAYENGQGVPKDPVFAYANYAIAARGGYKEYVEYRDDMAKQLAPAQMRTALALADDWKVGDPMPSHVAATGASPTTTAATSSPVKTRCSATGSMGGEKFSATNCAVSLYGDAHSVAIWFNEDPITAEEAAAFQLSSYADSAKGGKQRTMAIVMLCPGGGAATASPAAIKSIDLNTNHARSPLAGVQSSLEAQKDFKVEKMTGDIKPGGVLSGRIAGSRGKTSFNFDFDVTLPTKDAAAGLTCK